MKRLSTYSYLIVCLFVLTFLPFQTVFSQQTWIKTNALDSFYVTEMVSHKKEIFAVLYGAGVYKTSDEGKKWEACNNGLTDLFVRSILKKGNTLYVGTRTAGVFQSNNSGKSWQAINDTIISKNIYTLASHGDLLLAGTGTEIKTGSGSGKGSGVYLSKNKGKDWVRADLPQTDAQHQTIYCIGAKGNRIFAGSSQYLYLSEDRGDTWEAIKAPTNLRVTRFHLHGNQILMGTSGDGVFASSDGRNWTPYGDQKYNVRALIQENDILVMGVAIQGVLKGEEEINDGFSDIAIRSLQFHQGKLYAGTFKKGIWRYDLPNINLLSPLMAAKIAATLELYPNPIDEGLVNIAYQLDQATTVAIRLYDAYGKLLSEISPTSQQAAGYYQLSYDLSDLSVGTYHIHLQTDEESATKPLILIR